MQTDQDEYLARRQAQGEKPTERIEFETQVAHLQGMALRLRRISCGPEQWLEMTVLDGNNKGNTLRIPRGQVNELLGMLRITAGIRNGDGDTAS